MGLEDGDITALRRELTQELGQDDLVEEPDGAGPPIPPPSFVQESLSKPPPRTAADRMRRAREWVEECERELRDQPDVRRAARLYFEMARTCESPLKDTRRALQYYQAAL
ncbi:MAG: soluble NSF attachment family protein, partial [Myxococcales bacterium]|nr:soluble NSF attachment family protein [Myxococcales bacterium]